MEPANVIAIVFGIVGTAFGYLGWRKAGEANRIAATSNTIAQDSKRVAEESNRIAVEANDIARVGAHAARESADREIAAERASKTANLVVRSSNAPNKAIPTTKGARSGFIGLSLVNEGPSVARHMKLDAHFPNGTVRSSETQYKVEVKEQVELHVPVITTDFGVDGDLAVNYLVTYRDDNGQHATWWSVRIEGPWEADWRSTIEPM